MIYRIEIRLACATFTCTPFCLESNWLVNILAEAMAECKRRLQSKTLQFLQIWGTEYVLWDAGKCVGCLIMEKMEGTPQELDLIEVISDRSDLN